MQNVIIGENICFFLRKILTLSRKRNYGFKERKLVRQDGHRQECHPEPAMK